MPPRQKKLIGLIIFLITLFLYVILASEIIHVLPVESNVYLQMLVYPIVGLLWVIPAGAVIYWMGKEKDR